MNKLVALLLITGCSMAASATAQTRDLPPNIAKRVVRVDPANHRFVPSSHEGPAGGLRVTTVWGKKDFATNWVFLMRGEIPPGGGVGEHVHHNTEELYMIFDGKARFTVNGKTSELPGGTAVVCNPGDSHAIYNPTDTPVQWLGLAVGFDKGKGVTENLHRTTIDNPLEIPPPFTWFANLAGLERPPRSVHQGHGMIRGVQMYNNRAFRTNLQLINYSRLEPDATIGYHRHQDSEEVYAIMQGRGRMTLDGHTFDVQTGDFILNTIGGSHGIWNNGDDVLEILVIMVTLEKNTATSTNLPDFNLVGR